MKNDTYTLISDIKHIFAEISSNVEVPYEVDQMTDKGIRLLEELDKLIKQDEPENTEVLIRTDDFTWYDPEEKLPNANEDILIYTKSGLVHEGFLQKSPSGHRSEDKWYRYHFCNTLPTDRIAKWTYKPVPYPAEDICRILNDTYSAGHKIYVIADWHLIDKSHDGNDEIVIRKDIDQIISNANKVISQDDAVICLGDLFGKMNGYKLLAKEMIAKINGRKIMVIGNNDYYNPALYKRLGFEAAAYAFEWRNILFTHCPINNKSKYNIHGHLHTGQPYSSDEKYWSTYYIKPSNHINAYNKGCEPIDLEELITIGPNFSVPSEDGSGFPSQNTQTLIRLEMEEYNKYERIGKHE